MRRLIVGSLFLSCAVAVAIPSAAQQANWPQFGENSQHSSYAGDSAFSVSNASSLGINWMTNLYSPALGSPVVVYNATLGENVVYVGNERGDVFAINAANGQIIWDTNVGVADELRASPAVADNGDVWVATAYNPTLYKLNGLTGAVECSVKSPYTIDGSPMIATPPGGPETVYFGPVDGAMNGPVYAVNESSCAKIFGFQKYNSTAGIWVAPAFGVGSNGKPLVSAGTSDPDDTVYTFNALTGGLVWKYSAIEAGLTGDFDIGSAATISPPGNNGFADGVLYFNSKYGIEYANDLTTGTNIWQFNLCSHSCVTRSSAALDGNWLVFGAFAGVFAVNATTGTEIWETPLPGEALSSPAIIGQPGSEIVAFGDVTGAFRVLALSTGGQLYEHQTGGYITSSPAEANGNILIASSDGFLYSFSPGASNDSPPQTSISSPTNSSKLANPNGNVTITGTSTDTNGVAAVNVAIQSAGSSGQWYNAKSGTYGPSPLQNAATLANPGAKSTTWSFSFPAPAGGGQFEAIVNTTNVGHVVDPGAATNFSVLPSNQAPQLTVTSAYGAPGTGFEVAGHGFKPGETVQFSLFGKVAATAVTQATTGYVPKTRVPIPAFSPFGPTSITATGETSGKTSAIAVDITQEWTQYGYNSLRTNFEPQDPTIEGNVHVGKGSVLHESWYFSTGAPVNTTPAVVHGTVYAGDDAGVMSAIVTSTGAPLWTYTITSGAPIRGSPAVDGSGNVIFGANDGNLYTVSATGSLVHSTALSGEVSSPAISGNAIFVTNSNNYLFNVSDVTGTIVWQTQLGGTVTPAAYDSTNNMIIVGDSTGAITAFNATTGAQVWRATTGAAIVAAPSISNGVVYVGSCDNNLYALKESTGAVNWKFPVDSAILTMSSESSPQEGLIGVGTQNGTLYVIYTSGQLFYSSISGEYKSPLIGVAGVDGNWMTETSSGALGATRSDGGVAEYVFTYQTGAQLTTSPSIIDGTLYVGAADGGVYAFSTLGVTPQAVAVQHGGPIISITDAWSCSTQP